jgi:hypothetical protein
MLRRDLSTGGAYSSTLTGEGNKEGVFTAVTVDPSSTVGKNPTVEILIKGLGNLISQDPILVLESGFPLIL